jgi:polysaccharide biosynthesis/export protein
VGLRTWANRRAPGRRRRRCFTAALIVAIFHIGCADCRFLSQKCPQPRDPQAAADAPAPDVAYRVGCPDVIEVSFADFPGWDALAAVDLDGRLPLSSPGHPRAEGRTLEEIRADLARLAGVEPERVAVRLAAPRSSRVFVHGPIRGRTRIVPYQGPEPVIDFLTRVGGLPPGSKLSQVYVVRPNVATGGQPEVFRVDVPAVLIDGNPATNVALQPSDEVYIGETSRSVFARVLPDWLGPAYRRLTGLLPDDWWPFSKTRRP